MITFGPYSLRVKLLKTTKQVRVPKIQINRKILDRFMNKNSNYGLKEKVNVLERKLIFISCCQQLKYLAKSNIGHYIDSCLLLKPTFER